jgi:hypothetical protein
MRHPIDIVILIVLFGLLGLFMHALTYGAAKARPGAQVQRRAPISDLDRPGTRFDLLFHEPELVR